MAEVLFLKQAGTYAVSRPTYPPALFAFLSSFTSEHKLAWDVGTGNGQAASGVAEHYEKVIATDVSNPQLCHARKLPNVTYVLTPPVMTMEELHATVGPQGSVDLVTVAQALHWFDLDTFYAQVKLVLRQPGGIIAAWSYKLPVVTPAVDAVLTAFYKVTDPFWAPERKLVDEDYTTIDFPFDPVLQDGRGVGPIRDFACVKELCLEEYLMYLRSWSSVQSALDQNVTLLTGRVLKDFTDAWGEPLERRPVRWDIVLLLGKPPVDALEEEEEEEEEAEDEEEEDGVQDTGAETDAVAAAEGNVDVRYPSPAPNPNHHQE